MKSPTSEDEKGVANLNLQQFTTLFNVEMKRMPIIIKLLDETGQVTMTWTLQNAFIVKISKSANGEFVAIETAEVAHEGLTIS